jgi:hypothetical protein
MRGTKLEARPIHLGLGATAVTSGLGTQHRPR